MKGIGWIPLGSLEAEKNRKAMEIVSEKNYRQHPDKLKYSILMDSMPMVLATSNAKIMDDVSQGIFIYLLTYLLRFGWAYNHINQISAVSKYDSSQKQNQITKM